MLGAQERTQPDAGRTSRRGAGVVPLWRRILSVLSLSARGVAYAAAAFLGMVAMVLAVCNILFPAARDAPYRARDPLDVGCQVKDEELDVLARTNGAPTESRKVENDEWAAIDMLGPAVRRRFGCTVQRHEISGYPAPDGTTRRLGYDLAFLEFDESGKSYLLRETCKAGEKDCAVEHDEPVSRTRSNRNQLKALMEHFDALDKLEPKRPHYVLAFIHGWRHNADIGDSNVGDFRHYAAHAARFLEDRFKDDPANKPRVTAVYVGWRGARTDETRLKRNFGTVGEWIGTVSALPTLFDRKPVSEAIAPAALSALRVIEHRLKIDEAPPDLDGLPKPKPNRMIVFGHSLGGNMLATGLRDALLKKVARHEAGRYVQAPVGDLVVLINPAAEASKWTDIQRAVWSKIAMSNSERANWKEYQDGHDVFRKEQRPIVVSVTAALDWPAGGRGETDCAPPKANPKANAAEKAEVVAESARLARQNRRAASEGVEYDWATYDLFPAFKGDFRPVADTLIRLGSGRDPHDRCSPPIEPTWKQKWFGKIAVLAGDKLRVLPFMRTDMEETRTIGHLDPMRPSLSDQTDAGFSALPFGTTHELRGERSRAIEPERKRCVPKGEPRPDTLSVKACEPEGSKDRREIPVDYDEIVSAQAGCPAATGWVSEARDRQRKKYGGTHGQRWSSDDAEHRPALRFLHGFYSAGMAAITRANDPFWNIRAFDTALARHDGFMLSSFICAMNQLVMDDVTSFAPAPTAGGPSDTPPTPAASEP